MDNMGLKEFWFGKKVLITGHTGFKGSWLSFILGEWGANVVGLGLEPDHSPSLFEQLNLVNRVENHIFDIGNYDKVSRLLFQCQPDIVFHLAAQPIVRQSYVAPLRTWQTNVLGTVNLLESLNRLEKPCAAVVVTTDKVYENNEDKQPFKENDPLGGHDPYSSSKAAVELAVNSWRKSFFLSKEKPLVAVATARSGNVVGGGDWSPDRMVPDAIRSLNSNLPIEVRNPSYIRPWQHVLEPLYGYILLAQHLISELNSQTETGIFSTSFNFGPHFSSAVSVSSLVNKILEWWPGSWIDVSSPNQLHEAKSLSLNIQKAYEFLAWRPRWDFNSTVEQTVKWYKDALTRTKSDIKELTRIQIEEYFQAGSQTKRDFEN